MEISSYFIHRPRFSGVIAVVMVLVGLISIVILPISQYPQITPPQIVVSASYPGASADVLVDTVAVPIENALNGIEDMLYMTSSSNDNGTYQLTITFNLGTDADIAQVKVENRLQQAKPFLPDVVNQEGVSVRSQSANLLGFLVLESPGQTYDDLYLSNFAYTTLQNPLERISGVSNVSVYGPQYSMRVWLDPVKMTALGLTGESVVQAIESQNIQAALGSIGSAPANKGTRLVLSLNAKGFLNTVSEFQNIIVSTGRNGAVVRLKDIASVEMGADSYQLSATYNNAPSVILGLSQTPDSNALQIMKDIEKERMRLQKTLPPDMELKLVYNSADFVIESIKGIVSTLFTTFLLVVIVVYVFLQNKKATLIPMITIPVSLIATFAVIYLIGFDINILTLFATVLAVGLVVDDAIIVVERVQYLMKYQQMDSVSASVQAMKDIGSSIVATTMVLLAIFVPVGLMAGLTGKIYQQFAITIATAVLFSAINALTLSPALCAIFLKKKESEQNKRLTNQALKKKNVTSKALLTKNVLKKKKSSPVGLEQRFFNDFNELLDKGRDFYLRVSGWLGEHLTLLIIFLLSAAALIMVGFLKLPDSFIPEEDQGVLFANIQLSETASIQQTQSVLSKMGSEILQVNGISYFMGIAGESLLGGAGENIGMAVIGLKPWSERTTKELSIESINEKLAERFVSNSEMTVDFFALPAIPGIGNSGGLSFQLNAIDANATIEELSQGLDKLLSLLTQSRLFEFVFSTFAANTPHVYLDIDRTKLESYQIPISDVFAVLQRNFGSQYVNNITLAGQVNKVIVQADAAYRQDFQNIENTYLKTPSGSFVRLKEFMTLKITMRPKFIDRYNQYLTAAVTAQTASKVSTGTALNQIKILSEKLGNHFEIAWTGLSLQEEETQGLALILISLAVVFAYLFLVALYESWLISFSVIFSNLFAVLGALGGLYLMNLPLSIYAQLGIVLLIGLASKNAILMVQFIDVYNKQGMPAEQAALKGAGERFRAVLMTALTFILGVFPMVFATGAGAASQISLGTSVVFGMILATIAGIFFIPGLFVLFDKIILTFSTQKNIKPNKIIQKKGKKE